MTLTRAQFLDRVTSAKHGERIVYHVGFLHSDRQVTQWETVLHSKILDSVATAAFKACEQGHVHLFQRRLGDGTCEYIAQKIDPPRPFNWVGCYSLALQQYVRPKITPLDRKVRKPPPLQEAA